MQTQNKQPSKVALVRCDDYTQDAVDGAIAQAVCLLGGFAPFLRADERILLKPNLLKSAEPQRGVTTHPAVFSAVAKALRDAGYQNLTYGDSPGMDAPDLCAKTAGIEAAAKALNIAPADFSHGVSTEYPDGLFAKNFVICKGAVEADAIINICKMKTHALERVTGAVKNLFGCVHGLNKGLMHPRFADADSFAGMLADLNRMLPARLHVMDGIMAMEGNGPASGTAVPMRTILMSADPVALDSVFCALVHLDPTLVPTNIYGQRAGLGVWESDQIEVLTADGTISVQEAADRFGNPEFDVRREPATSSGTGFFGNNRLFAKLFTDRPHIIRENCVRCGKCVKSCPLETKAVTMKDKTALPKYDYNLCIRCWCCQEICPHEAIDVKTPLMARLMRRG